ncbi:zinc finger protein ZFP2-like isoform X10 [Euwallacea similis]|uniref:zinc finger protein ZFP2-like isoform X10 n=1 Tax=Euwallacea similis TaxID=1736056 RepID=UPI00344D2355
MDNPGEILRLCRLCLVKDQVNIPIFEEQGDIRQTFLKIRSCLPVKVSRDDKLPKKICGGCSNKLDLFYEFWSSTANSEKTLQSWLGQEEEDDKMQEITKPVEALVKEESEALEDGHAHDQSFDEATKDEAEAPPAKRARRTAAVKAQINISHDSDEDEDVDGAEPITKIEDESDDSDGEEKDPSYTEVPGTSADDQAGPSGLGKDGVEAPMKYKILDYNSDPDDLAIAEKPFKFVGKDEESFTIVKTEVGYPCPYCSKPFMQRCKLKNHLIIHSAERPWRCQVCDKTFKHKRVLDYHEKTVHGDPQNYPCDICGKIFSNKRNCVVHRNRHTKEYTVKCQECGKAFLGNFYLKKHMIVHSEERPHQCPACGKRFKHQRVLDYHFKTLHGDESHEKHPCDICGKIFSNRRNCDIHRKRHLKQYTVYCEHCGKGFLNNFYLNKHLNAKHYGKRHICDVCGASIGDKSNMRNHMKLHDPNYKKPLPEVCNICHKAFSNLKRHYKAAHENDGKNYKCEYCGKFFRGKDGLKFHLMIHRGEKPFSCEFCGKAFILNTFLQQHLRTHPESNVKPFECSVCEKTFIKKSLLEYHMNTHTGSRPFQCEFCSKAFTGRKYLTAHVRSQHAGGEGGSGGREPVIEEEVKVLTLEDAGCDLI